MSQYQQRIGTDRRVHQRLEDGRASLVELGGDNSGIVLNISEGGMAILSTEDLDVNALGNLRFQAPEFEHWIETAADIAWISDSRKQAGIRFKDLSETVRTQLRAGISIATVRARWADQAKRAGVTTERLEQVTDSMLSVATADSVTVVASESENVPNEANSNSLVEQNHQDKESSNSEGHEASPDSPSPEARRENEPESEIDTKEKSISPGESKKDARTGPFDFSDIKPMKPRKTSVAVALDARSSPLALQKSALAEIRFRNIVANSGLTQSSGGREGISRWNDISYRKWVPVAAIAILASILAFLAGWIMGDPSRMKVGH